MLFFFFQNFFDFDFVSSIKHPTAKHWLPHVVLLFHNVLKEFSKGCEDKIKCSNLLVLQTKSVTKEQMNKCMTSCTKSQ